MRTAVTMFVIFALLFSAYPVHALDDQFTISFTITSSSTSTTTPTTTPTTTTTTTTGGGGGGSPGGFGGTGGGTGLPGTENPPTPPGEEQPVSPFAPNQVTRLEVVPDVTSVHIEWNTSKESNHTFRYGKTSQYELGTVVSSAFTSLHVVELSGLDPDTQYFFAFDSQSSNGEVASDQNETFTTLAGELDLAPPNVGLFSAQPVGGEVVLLWQNPSTANFDSVRILRSNQFFPVNVFDGATVYEGSGETSVDSDVSVGQTYYYTAFARGVSGLFSSGATAQVTLLATGEGIEEGTTPPTEEVPPVEGEGVPGEDIVPGEDGGTTGTTTLQADSEDLIPENEIEISQDGIEGVGEGETTEIIAGEIITFSIPADKVPDNVQTVSLQITSPGGEISSFLLRLAPDGLSYNAILPAIQETGRAIFKVIFLGFDNQEVGRTEGALTVVPAPREEEGISVAQDLVLISGIIVVIIVSGFMVLYVLRRFVRI